MIGSTKVDVLGSDADQAVDWMAEQQGALVRGTVLALLTQAQVTLANQVALSAPEILGHNELPEAIREHVQAIARYESFLNLWDQIRNRKIPLQTTTTSIVQ